MLQYPIIHVYLMDEEAPHITLNLVSNANTTVMQLHQQMLKVGDTTHSSMVISVV